MSGKAKIGASIALDGEKEYKQAISEINKALSVLGSEMKKVTAQFDGNANSIDGLNAKQDVLERKLLTQKDKVDILKKALQESAEKYGEASSKTQDYQIKLNNAEAELLKTEKAIRETTEQLNKMGNEADQAGDKIEKAGLDSKKAGEKANSSGKDWGNLKDGLAKVGAVIAGVTAAITGLVVGLGALTESTKEYRKDLSFLEQNAKTAGNSFDVIKTQLKNLTAITNETDSSIEALSNLMAAGFDDHSLAKAVDALSGAVIKFPDTLKIESLADALQETIATGKATGQFAELIERMGGSLEDFNTQMNLSTTAVQKQSTALWWLANSGLPAVNEEYRKTNADTIAAANAQFEMNEKLSQLSSKIEPVITKFKVAFLEQLAPWIDKISEKIETINFQPIINAMVYVIQNLPKIITLIGTLGAAFLAFKGVQVITSLVGAFSSLTGATAAASAGIAAMAGPIGLVAAAVAGLGLSVGILAAKNEWFTGKNKKQYEYWPATPNMNTDVYGPSLPAQQNQALPAQQNQASQKVYTPANSPYQVTVPLSLNMDGREVARQSFSFNLAEGNIRGLQLVQ